MLNHRFLASGLLLILSGCAARSHSTTELPPGTRLLRDWHQLDGGKLGRALDCPSLNPVTPGEYASTEVEFVILPSGKVAAGSAHAIGDVRRYSAGYPSGEAPGVTTRRVQEETIRARASREAERCVYERPLKDGEPVAVRARLPFRVTI
jgi:hypothetical protein